MKQYEIQKFYDTREDHFEVDKGNLKVRLDYLHDSLENLREFITYIDEIDNENPDLDYKERAEFLFNEVQKCLSDASMEMSYEMSRFYGYKMEIFKKIDPELLYSEGRPYNEVTSIPCSLRDEQYWKMVRDKFFENSEDHKDAEKDQVLWLIKIKDFFLGEEPEKEEEKEENKDS